MPKNTVKIKTDPTDSKSFEKVVHIKGSRLGGRKSVQRINGISTLELQTGKVRGRDKNKVAAVLRKRGVNA